ncbi:tetraacyldisaccharide 4'-kinase [Pseudopelagicola sp. nBUS_19]|uniref:tetraacyldisaccharide 4'-kinase n=1 Tax=Pseudopelagicola sp. nBUS_19 TaxID=3395316 RepID=UPI003EBF30D0
MRSPHFWDGSTDKLSWQARLLAPVGTLYALGTRFRITRSNKAFRADVPVVCVGNLNAGGTGKTPTTIALAQYLIARRLTPHIVSRGYGGSIQGPVKVDEGRHTSVETGDEPLLLAAFAPTWVARNRAIGVATAQKAGADVILLDDGFQNPAVHKDLSIVVVDAARGFGNGLCIPAGPLREKVSEGLKRADLLLSIGSDEDQAIFSDRWGERVSTPHLRGALAPLQTGMDWSGVRCLAFAGIGHPEKFFATLRGLGANVVREQALDDHQNLTPGLLARLIKEAGQASAQLVTTEKDAVRLPSDLRPAVLTVPVRLEISDTEPLDAALDRILKTRSPP